MRHVMQLVLVLQRGKNKLVLAAAVRAVHAPEEHEASLQAAQSVDARARRVGRRKRQHVRFQREKLATQRRVELEDVVDGTLLLSRFQGIVSGDCDEWFSAERTIGKVCLPARRALRRRGAFRRAGEIRLFRRGGGLVGLASVAREPRRQKRAQRPALAARRAPLQHGPDPPRGHARDEALHQIRLFLLREIIIQKRHEVRSLLREVLL